MESINRIQLERNNYKKLSNNNFDKEDFLGIKKYNFEEYVNKERDEILELKDGLDDWNIFVELGFPKDEKKIIKFIGKENIAIDDLINYKDLFLYLKYICGRWFDYAYVSNQQNPSQYIIKDTIELIKWIKLWKYNYKLVQDVLSNKNDTFTKLFWNKKSISFMGWQDVLSLIEDKDIIKVTNYIKSRNLSLDFGDGISTDYYGINFNLIIMITRFLKKKDLTNSDEDINKWINVFVDKIKDKFNEKYDWAVLFSVDQYDHSNQFKNDQRLFQNINKSILWNDSIIIKWSYEFVKQNIIENIQKLKNKWKKNILVYISCHWSENWDSYFEDRSWIWTIKKVFSRTDLEEISKMNNWISEYDKCYGSMNSWIDINTVCGNYIWNTWSKLRLIKWLDDKNYNYNKAKFLQIFNANTIIDMYLE